MNEFYEHGVDMASEIPTSEKSDGFNQYWNHNYGGSAGRAEARRQYNRGWADYKSGRFKPEPSLTPYLIIGGFIALTVYLFKKATDNTSSLSGIGPVTKDPELPYTIDQLV